MLIPSGAKSVLNLMGSHDLVSVFTAASVPLWVKLEALKCQSTPLFYLSQIMEYFYVFST